ncbi:helix-turn-helix domain-containing protein [Streptomyces sp. NPDC056411]|uniref:helix-turn-helix domain-containing protein n=1 Tax=Streptomyces sp. NPDC056411 TaxID=3345813 RepID=UPI0035D6C575
MSTPPSSSAVKEARVSFGQRLRGIRKDSGLTARALAALAGWHESKCSKLESGARPPSFDDIRAYAHHCGVPHLANDLIDTVRGIDGMYVEWRQLERSGPRPTSPRPGRGGRTGRPRRPPGPGPARRRGPTGA